MTFEEAMTEMKLGRVARREGWTGHVRIDGLQIIRVQPNILPHRFFASAADKRADDWVVSKSPGVSILPPLDLGTFADPVDGGDARS